MLIHKETFKQPTCEGIPSHWVVMYWEGSPEGFCKINFFSTLEDALEFESTLTQYDDWYTSQEEVLRTQ